MLRADFISKVKEIDWPSYDGAYNYMDDSIASKFVELISYDEKEAYESAGFILGHVCHQGNFYEASIPAMKMLFEAIEIFDCTTKWVAMDAILYLMQESFFWQERFAMIPQNLGFPGQFPIGEPSEIRGQLEANRIMSNIVDIFEHNVSNLIPLLCSKYTLERAYAIRLLGASNRPTREMMDSIIELLSNEETEEIRCGCLLTIGNLIRCGIDATEKALHVIQKELHADKTTIIACGVASFILIDANTCIRETGANIGKLLFANRLHSDTFPWFSGSVAAVLAEALSLSDAPDEFIIDILTEVVTERSKKKITREIHATSEEYIRSDAFAELIERERIEYCLMRRLFHKNHLAHRHYLTSNDLTPLQRSALTRLGRNGLKITCGKSFGFRDLAKDINRLIGLERGGFDEEIESYWEGTKVRWPLWKWWYQAGLLEVAFELKDRSTPKEFVLHLIEHKLSAKQIFAAALDAANGGYDIPHEDLVRLAANRAEELRNEIRSMVEQNEIEAMNGKMAALFVMASLALARHESIDWADAVVRAIDKVQPQELREEAAELAAEYGLTS